MSKKRKKSIMAIVKAMGRHIFRNQNYKKKPITDGDRQYQQYIIEGKLIGNKLKRNNVHKKKPGCYGSKTSYI